MTPTVASVSRWRRKSSTTADLLNVGLAPLAVDLPAILSELLPSV